jgi:hypothetical protein
MQPLTILHTALTSLTNTVVLESQPAGGTLLLDGALVGFMQDSFPEGGPSRGRGLFKHPDLLAFVYVFGQEFGCYPCNVGEVLKTPLTAARAYVLTGKLIFSLGLDLVSSSRILV